MLAGDCTLPVERWTPFKHIIEFQRVDLVGMDARLQVRSRFDQAGLPLIDLVVTPSGEGISIYAGTAPGMTSTNVEIRINETTIEGLPFADPRGGEWRGVWDLHVGTGVTKKRWLQGAFVVRPGATQ